MLAVHLRWRRQLMDCLYATAPQVGCRDAERSWMPAFGQIVEAAHEASRPRILNHGLRPVIGVLRAMSVTISSPVRLLLTSLR